ncbi:MAG: LytTR family transcriptional regulator [Chitinophagaceae bacterium]|nr:LytTR family transcriptional regulator [Chitinophagaceae bacterium]
MHATLTTLKKVEEKLPPEKFLRVHSAHIVALQKLPSVIYFGSNGFYRNHDYISVFLRPLSIKLPKMVVRMFVSQNPDLFFSHFSKKVVYKIWV